VVIVDLPSMLPGVSAALSRSQKRPRRFLDAEGMVEVVKELRRLLPGADAGLVLRNDPSWLLRWASPRGPRHAAFGECASERMPAHVRWTCPGRMLE
jgi:hypothetical protein